jgi:hypothetical protein
MLSDLRFARFLASDFAAVHRPSLPIEQAKRRMIPTFYAQRTKFRSGNEAAR